MSVKIHPKAAQYRVARLQRLVLTLGLASG